MKKNLLIPLLLFFSWQHSLAQVSVGAPGYTDQKNNNSIQGNSKANIYNTSLYTGTANVNIPIYNFSLCKLDLGVSLSYDTKGVKVDQIASTAGLGWSVNGGGYIEREVNGYEDECKVPALTPNDVMVNGIAFPRVPLGLGSWCLNGTSGDQLDKFTAVLPGRVITFNVDFSLNGGPVAYTIPKSEVSITVVSGGNIITSATHPYYFDTAASDCTGPIPNQSDIKFRIGDEKGNVYYFEPKDYEVKQVLDADSDDHLAKGPADKIFYYPVTKWVLTKVIAYNGEQVIYNYDTTRISYLQYDDDAVIENEDYTFSSGRVKPTVVVKHSNQYQFTGPMSYLTSINYPNGTNVNFNYSFDRCDVSNAPTLKTITINSQYDNTISNSLSYNFNYAYFTTPYSFVTSTEMPYTTSCSSLNAIYGSARSGLDGTDIWTRLKLKSIDRVGTDNATTENYYTFTYNNTSLPARLSPYQDWWGYSNGSTMTALPDGTYVRVPYHLAAFTDPSGNVYTSYYGVHREPNFAAAQADVLTSIKNGSGGETDLYYKDFANYTVTDTPSISDLRTYNAQPNTTGAIDPDLLGGNTSDGLVLDKVVTTDGYNHDNDVTVQYDYSMGQQFYPGEYFWYPKTYTDYTYSQVYSKVWTNHPINPMDLIDGSNHGFRNVTVTTSGINGQISKETYSYSGLYKPAGMSTSSANLYIWGASTLHSMPRKYIYPSFFSLLLKQTSYDPSGDILSQTVNTYGMHNLSGMFPYYNSPNPTSEQNIDQYQFTVNYPGSSGPMNILGTYHNLGDCQDGVISGDPLTNIFLPVITQSVQTTYSGAISSSQTTNYTYDASNYDNVTAQTWTDSKGNSCEKDYWWNIFAPTNIYFAPAVVQHMGGETLKRNGNIVSQYHLLPYMCGGLPGENPYVQYPTFDNATFNPALSLDTAKRFTQFDAHANVVETQYRISNTYSSALWDTRIGQKVADVQNARFVDIAYTSFEGSFSATPPGSTDYLKGNWEFDPDDIFPDSARTGHYSYLMSPSGPSNVIRNVNALTTGKKYIVSFWVHGNVPQVYTSATIPPTVPASLRYFTPTLQYQAGTWGFYTVAVTGNYDDIYIAPPSFGADLYIDELRLYPADAEMNSYTYEPLLGVSSHSDERGNITFYGYDVQGRQNVIRDVDGNIISLTKTVNQGLDN